jgi:flagellar basal body-associated protein FliL
MPWLIAFGILIVAGLGWYAWSLTRQVKTQEEKRAQARQDALLGIQILIDSYLDDQVDRSECLLRIRVLLDAHHDHWLSELQLNRFDEVSDAILAMPFGEARQQIDVKTRREHDAARRQLLQIHEAELEAELKRLKEWIDQ